MKQDEKLENREDLKRWIDVVVDLLEKKETGSAFDRIADLDNHWLNMDTEGSHGTKLIITGALTYEEVLEAKKRLQELMKRL